MSEELLLNDRRDNLIQVMYRKLIFLYGCKKFFPQRDTNPWPPDPYPAALTIALCVTMYPNCNRLYISNKLHFGESNRDHSKMMNEIVRKSFEKSKKCSRRKARSCQAKNLHKKDTNVYNNCYELRSRAIKNESYSMANKIFSVIYYQIH